MAKAHLRRKLLAPAIERIEAVRHAGAQQVTLSIEDAIDWMEALGCKIRNVHKLEEATRYILESACGGTNAHLLMEGPRGGGKTYWAAVVMLALYRWYGSSGSILGGSQTQSDRCYEHIAASYRISPDLQEYGPDPIASKTTAHCGNKIETHAASEKSVRGAHPKGTSGVGVLILDERAQIHDKLADTAILMGSAAQSFILIELSTRANDTHPGQRFNAHMDSPPNKSMAVRFGAFDAASACPYPCEQCPVPEHFAKDFYADYGAGSAELIHTAYCAGKAHETHGHLSIDVIADTFLKIDRETFESEMLGIDRPSGGFVFGARLIEEAVSAAQRGIWLVHPSALTQRDREAVRASHDARFRTLEKTIGIDWGYSGECAVVWIARIGNHFAPYRFRFFTRIRGPIIWAQIVDSVFEDRVSMVLADSSHPADIAQVDYMIHKRIDEERTGEEDVECEVDSVVFGKEKRMGYGESKRLLEQGALLLPAAFGGQPVEGHETAIDYLKQHRRDARGEPAKDRDHCSDALMCAVLRWTREAAGAPQVY